MKNFTVHIYEDSCPFYSTTDKPEKNMSDDDLGLHDLLAGMSPQTVETKIFRQLLQEEYTNRK